MVSGYYMFKSHGLLILYLYDIFFMTAPGRFQNLFFCVPQKKESYTGLEPHESE